METSCLGWNRFLLRGSKPSSVRVQHLPPSPVTSGVPQGSVVGPLLFLTYINDLPNGLTSTVKLFADDTLLYGMVVDDSDCDNLQEDVNKLEIWQHEWQMQFNPSKCNIICISNKQRPPQRTYFFCGSKLEQVDSASYLGITVNRKLKWSEHISSISSRASRSLGLIKRNLWNCPRKVRETAYTSIVRPKLEYASASWNPYYKKDISTLERVQRKAARFCLQNFNKTASVTIMLSDLNWDTLETRRKKNRLTLMYKLSHNLVDVNTKEHLIPNSEKRTRNSHVFCISRRASRTDAPVPSVAFSHRCNIDISACVVDEPRMKPYRAGSIDCKTTGTRDMSITKPSATLDRDDVKDISLSINVYFYFPLVSSTIFTYLSHIHNI